MRSFIFQCGLSGAHPGTAINEDSDCIALKRSGSCFLTSSMDRMSDFAAYSVRKFIFPRKGSATLRRSFPVGECSDARVLPRRLTVVCWLM